jgi:uncharacterized DUF497 family protein
MAEFEWDPQKEVINVRKHGFDVATASRIGTPKLSSGSTIAGTMEKCGSSQPDESTR